MFRKLIYRLYENYRNPSLKADFHFLIESDRWTLPQLQNYQISACRELLFFAAAYSPYYKQQFQKSGFSPETFHSLEDLKKLPITDKKTLTEHNKQLQAVYPFKKTIYSKTSGSTGEILSFYRDEAWESFHMASIFRGLSWYGISRWDKSAVLSGSDAGQKTQLKIQILDFIRNQFRLSSYNKRTTDKFIGHLNKAVSIQGYSSMIYELACMCNRKNNSSFPKLKLVKGTSDMIFDSYREEIKKAFGKPIISEYGAAETGIIAFECPEGNMHINMEGVIVEESDGEIIVTNLHSRSFPIIRYRLGDYIRLAPEGYKCPCGRQHPVLLELQGRVGGVICGKTIRFPSVILNFAFKEIMSKYNRIFSYQGIQKEKSRLTIRIAEAENPGDREIIKRVFEHYLKDDVILEILFSQDLRPTQGKRNYFISEI